MRLSEIELKEEPVISSWIEDLAYDEAQGGVMMTLDNGRQYIVHDMSEDDYEFWFDSESKGQHWHTYIRDMHNVDRLY